MIGADVQVVVKVADNVKKVRVLAGNLVLAGDKVDFLVDVVESLQYFLVGHVSRGLRLHNIIGGSKALAILFMISTFSFSILQRRFDRLAIRTFCDKGQSVH